MAELVTAVKDSVNNIKERRPGIGWVRGDKAEIELESVRKDDVYSWVREKLVGKWTCTFETYLITKERTFEKGTVVRQASIEIHPGTRKLDITFSQLESDLFSNRVFNLVGSGLSNHGNSHHLTIFGTYEQKVRSGVKSISGRDEIVMPILYALKFHIGRQINEVDEMAGAWYDLENVVVRSIYINLSQNADKKRFAKYIETLRSDNPALELVWKRNK
jgi:hypothetical protein